MSSAVQSSGYGHAGRTRDYEAWEVGSAIIVAIAIQFGLGVLIVLTSTTEAPIPEVEKGEEPVRVIPVIDEEAFKAARLGGKKAVLPDMWNRAPASIKKKIQETPPPPPDDVIAPSTAKPDDPDRPPDPDKKLANVEDAGDPKDADPEGADAGNQDSNEDAGDRTLDTDGGNSGAGGPGCTGPGCEKDGGLDDFVGAQYNGRLVQFFRRGFAVSGLGLPEDEIKKLMVSCSVSLSGDGTVTAASCGSTGNSAFDAA
ncbi:MAG: hypothetical protein JNK04_20645, partial [Myxococcales bacterium]|nr:hypothetical protein [Myxococcales bacterium]